ncbi:hypothetical protein BJ508DRAFT_304651 [Ascobolus immersus RN42]|uniref:Uncharacterized protein n=1 Tax=Ascobolus immersus RN42 TaxID=1160509 RepID=A0A3N4IGZ6_ASCIM|nr:hypothetical protein BJ508DRAFT_304651 [Ascobolus immersus RN42]
MANVDIVTKKPSQLLTLPCELQLAIFESVRTTKEIINLRSTHPVLHHLYFAYERQILIGVAKATWEASGALDLLYLLRRVIFQREITKRVFKSCLGPARASLFSTIEKTLRRNGTYSNPDTPTSKSEEDISMDDLRIMELFDATIVAECFTRHFTFRAKLIMWDTRQTPHREIFSSCKIATESEKRRITRAIYRTFRAIEYMHGAVTEVHAPWPWSDRSCRFPSPLQIYDSHAELVLEDEPQTEPMIDVGAFFRDVSVGEHMEIVAAMGRQEFCKCSHYALLLLDTLRDRLLDLISIAASDEMLWPGYFGADMEDVRHFMLRTVYESLYDKGQANVSRLLGDVSKFGWEGGFNKRKYAIIADATRCIGGEMVPLGTKLVIPDVSGDRVDHDIYTPWGRPRFYGGTYR